MNLVALLNAILFVQIALYRIHLWSIEGMAEVIVFTLSENKTQFITPGYYSEFYTIAALISNKRSGVAVCRYQDGELLIMIGKAFPPRSQAARVDNNDFLGGASRLGDELKKSTTGMRGRMFYYCWLNRYSPGFKANHLTFDQTYDKFCSGNIFCNRNWMKTRLLVEELVAVEYGRIILFCSKDVRPDEELGFARHIVRFPGNCVDNFEKYGDEWLANATALAKNYSHTLFMFSIGPLSPVFIWYMFQANPTNRYIDFGSTIDLLLRGVPNRPYMKKDWKPTEVEPTWMITNDQRVLPISQ